MSEMAIEAEHHALYRFYDEDGALLYVGISVNPLGRWDQHRAKTWWRDVRSATIEPCESRERALEAEVAAIRAENPEHNIRRGLARRSIFIQRDTWEAAKALAAEDPRTGGANVSDIVRELVEDYVKLGGRR